jgi:replication fork protection complex subunit Csm3/Swi3
MVEKLGHKKRIQLMRMDWINEGKPRESVHEDSIFDEPALPPREPRDTTASRIASIFDGGRSERPKTPGLFVGMEDDIYDATPKPTRTETTGTSNLVENSSLFGPRRIAPADEPEDDLDALLAEAEMEEASTVNRPNPNHQDDKRPPSEQGFDDEMEAMAEMGFDMDI